MKSLLLIFIVLFQITCLGQTEYKKHLKSLKSKSWRRNSGFIETKDSTFLDYALNNIIKQNEIIYISDRTLLKSLPVNTCFDNYIEMIGIINKNKKITIELKTQEFDSTKNKIEKYNQEWLNNYTEKINGLYPYGGTYSNPKFEFSKFQITIDGKTLSIPDSVFKNLYDPNFCEFGGFVKNIQAFTSLNEEYIYLYIYGSNAAGSYFSKLIFDHKKYVTKWVVNYGPLSNFGCFRESFIGF